jgi:hypothetical protein
LVVISALGEDCGVLSFQASDDSFVHLLSIKGVFAVGFTPLGAVCVHRAVLLPKNEGGRHCARQGSCHHGQGEREDQSQRQELWQVVILHFGGMPMYDSPPEPQPALNGKLSYVFILEAPGIRLIENQVARRMAHDRR